jgi:hypothetical protein
MPATDSLPLEMPKSPESHQINCLWRGAPGVMNLLIWQG